jgi:hypothetical protein
VRIRLRDAAEYINALPVTLGRGGGWPLGQLTTAGQQ